MRVPIRHCLLVPAGTDYGELESACSRPQALGQRRTFLARHHLEPGPFDDTAGAARWLASERPESAAVIARAPAAELHGLEIVKEASRAPRRTPPGSWGWRVSRS